MTRPKGISDAEWSIRRKAHDKKWYENNREYRRAYQYQRKYGISIDAYNAMVEEQGECCALCGTDQPNTRWGLWHIDHCDKTNTVRRLLCNCCNLGLGLFNHDPVLLQRAIDYLKDHRDR